MRFRTSVELFGTTATGLRVPAATVAVYGDEYFLPLSAANRAGAAFFAGLPPAPATSAST